MKASIEEIETATEGERLVHRFIEEAARPRGDYDFWYEPQLGHSGLSPDFILYGKSLGLVVLEVKDWVAGQIVSYDPHRFKVVISGNTETKTNPLKQAGNYMHALMDVLKGHGEFLSQAPEYEGRLKIPIGTMVVFPNISHQEWENRGLYHLIPWKNALLKDDLAPAGEILCDESGRKFKECMSGCLPFAFKGMPPGEEKKLRFLLWPEGHIELPGRSGLGKSRFKKEVLYLDEAQARAALRLKPGHQVVKGPPGSGKTLVLVHRCAHLVRFHPERRRILLVCFNIALVSFLKRLVQEKGMGVLGEEVPYEKEDSEFYDMVIQEALSRVEEPACPVEPFDAVLVDEGQDFNPDMFRVLLALLRPGGDLVIARDSHQDLYLRNGASWKSLGVRASGRTTHLRTVYRNTSEIAVIYDDKECGPESFFYADRDLPARLLEGLDRAGVPAAWVSRDVRAKEMYDITTDRVSLISVHSAKGLDFDLVYLVGMDRIRPADHMWEKALSLVFTAMTRAKYRLVIPYVEETELIQRMKGCLVGPVE